MSFSLKTKVRKYAAVLGIDARQQFAYRGEFVMRGFMIAIFMIVFCALWRAVFDLGGRQDMGGLGYAQMIWYLAMTETMILSGSRIFVQIGEAVRSGDVAYTLVRPYHYIGFQIAHALGNSLPRLALNFVVSSLVVLPFARSIETTWAGFAGLVVLALGSVLLNAMVAVLIGLAAFVIEDPVPIYWLYSKLLMSVGGMFLPLDVFPPWLRQISERLPFQFMIYAPAKTFVDFNLGLFLNALLGQAIYVVVIWLLLLLVWRWGSRRLVIHGG